MIYRLFGKQLPLRLHLVLLVLSSMLPLLIFAGSTLLALARQQAQNMEISLHSTTRALASTVEEQIDSLVLGLEILGESEDFHSRNLPETYQKAVRIVSRQAIWKSIAVAKADGTQLFNTQVPFGSRLPSLAKEDILERALLSRSPSFSDVLIDPASGEMTLSVAVPVQKDSSYQYVVIGSIFIESLTNLLREQKLDPSWTAVILDSNSRIIARSRSMNKFAGKPAPQALASRSRAHIDGIFESVAPEGHKTYGAFRRLHGVDWTVVLDLPAASVRRPVYQTSLSLISGGFFLILIAIFFALFIGRSISTPILALSKSAISLSRGESPPSIPSSVVEISFVSQAMARAGKDLAEERQLRDHFLSVASHDLKSPMGTIDFQCQVLEEELEDGTLTPEKLQEATERIRKNSSKVIALVDELLDVSRITAGQMEVRFEEVELVSLIQDIATQLESESKRTGSKLEIVGDSPVKGLWDTLRLDQVFTNLISNAFKYGSGQPIKVSISKNSEEAIVTVEDRGIGIALEDQKRIFNRFERAVSGQNIKGLGLGLWIVQLIVHSLGGHIGVQSQPGQGSIFTVRLPLDPTSSKVSSH